MESYVCDCGVTYAVGTPCISCSDVGPRPRPCSQCLESHLPGRCIYDDPEDPPRAIVVPRRIPLVRRIRYWMMDRRHEAKQTIGPVLLVTAAFVSIMSTSVFVHGAMVPVAITGYVCIRIYDDE